jgi:hypothetical protein
LYEKIVRILYDQTTTYSPVFTYAWHVESCGKWSPDRRTYDHEADVGRMRRLGAAQKHCPDVTICVRYVRSFRSTVSLHTVYLHFRLHTIPFHFTSHSITVAHTIICLSATPRFLHLYPLLPTHDGARRRMHRPHRPIASPTPRTYTP